MDKKQKWISLGVISTIVTISACGNGNHCGALLPPPPYAPQASLPQGSPQPLVQPANSILSGNWIYNCQYDPEKNVSAKIKLKFDGNTVKSIGTIYSDQNCQTPAFKQQFKGTFQLQALPNMGGAMAIDYDISSMIITFYDQSFLASIVNEPVSYRHSHDEPAGASCDLSVYGFQLETPIDVSDQEACLHKSWIGRQRHSLVQVNGNLLYIGKEETGYSGESPKSRSIHLEQVPLVRQ